MDKHKLKKLHKILFSMLAKQPDIYGLLPDKDGWIKIKDVQGALIQEPELPNITTASLMQFFDVFGYETFETNNLCVRVRDRKDLPLPQTAAPPEILYVPIRPKTYELVAMEGIVPQHNKEWVILSTTKELAVKIGRRRDNNPIISEVMALNAENDGVIFKKFGENLFLADAIKPKYIKLPPQPKNKQKNNKETTKPNSKHANTNLNPYAPKDLINIGGYALSTHPITPQPDSQSPVFDDKKKKKRFRDNEPAWKQARRIQKKKR